MIQKIQCECKFRKLKKPDVRIFSARDSGARNDCASFMGTWHFLELSAGNPHAHKIPRFRGGGGLKRFLE